MRTLLDFLNTLTRAQQASFCARCGTSLGYVRKAGSVRQVLNPRVCVAIERNSLMSVRRWDLRPDDWHLIWPELIGAEGAPPVPQTTEEVA